MVLRILLNFINRFANSEQMINKLAESYPIRRSAQFIAYFYHRSIGYFQTKDPTNFQLSNNRLTSFKNRFINEFRQEMENNKRKLK